MADPLSQLVDDGILEEVISRLKSGKEADIYLVQHAGEIVAAKVYKERNARNFKNNAVYKEGRQVRNTRTQRAMDRGSRFGQAASEEAWKTKESEALSTLFAAGLRVPQPVMFYEGVLLMEAVIDPEGHPAPRLMDAPIPPERAGEYYADLRSQVVRMLCCDIIHGDLSPYNVLLAWNGPVIIDFPQVIGAAHNNQAERFFARDLNTLLRFFTAIDSSLHACQGDAREIWRAYQRRELTPDFIPSGRFQEEPAPSPGLPRRTFEPTPAGRGPRTGGGGGQRERSPGLGRGQKAAGGAPGGGGRRNRGPAVLGPQGREGRPAGTPNGNHGGHPQDRARPSGNGGQPKGRGPRGEDGRAAPGPGRELRGKGRGQKQKQARPPDRSGAPGVGRLGPQVPQQKGRPAVPAVSYVERSSRSSKEEGSAEGGHQGGAGTEKS